MWQLQLTALHSIDMAQILQTYCTWGELSVPSISFEDERTCAQCIRWNWIAVNHIFVLTRFHCRCKWKSCSTEMRELARSLISCWEGQHGTAISSDQIWAHDWMILNGIVFHLLFAYFCKIPRYGAHLPQMAANGLDRVRPGFTSASTCALCLHSESQFFRRRGQIAKTISESGFNWPELSGKGLLLTELLQLLVKPVSPRSFRSSTCSSRCSAALQPRWCDWQFFSGPWPKGEGCHWAILISNMLVACRSRNMARISKYLI